MRALEPTIFYYEPLDAEVYISPRLNARRFTARWRNGRVLLSAPRYASEREALSVLDNLASSLKGMRPAPLYAHGAVMRFDNGEIHIDTQTNIPGRIISDCEFDDGRYKITIGLPPDADPSAPDIARLVSRLICERAKWLAHLMLIPQAKLVAERIGQHPTAWGISSGLRILGRCDRRGIISLSYALIFAPTDIREFVICHELAHLREMNHSPRFHEILEEYCGGREKEYTRRLKAVKWPYVK